MNRPVTLAGYVLLAAAFITCELVARRTARVAPLMRVLDALARRRPLWLAALAAWLWTGWHLFVRAQH